MPTPKYVYQTYNNRIASLFPSDIDWRTCTNMPPEYGWYFSDVEVPYNLEVGEDGQLLEPEPLPPRTALETPMTSNVSWSEVIKVLDAKDPLFSAVLQLFAAKFEGNSEVADSALSTITQLVRKANERPTATTQPTTGASTVSNDNGTSVT
jgi:hypothetical protein